MPPAKSVESHIVGKSPKINLGFYNQVMLRSPPKMSKMVTRLLSSREILMAAKKKKKKKKQHRFFWFIIKFQIFLMILVLGGL